MHPQHKSICGEELKKYHLYQQRESWSRIRVFITPRVDSSFPVIGYNGGTIQEQHSQTLPFQKFAQRSFSAQVQINPFQTPCPHFSKKLSELLTQVSILNIFPSLAFPMQHVTHCLSAVNPRHGAPSANWFSSLLWQKIILSKGKKLFPMKIPKSIWHKVKPNMEEEMG